LTFSSLFSLLSIRSDPREEMSPSPVNSLCDSSECLVEPDDSDLPKSVSSPEPVIIAPINPSSPSKASPLTHHAPTLSLRDYLHALDRHKSIDNCFLSPASADRLILFDEIKKITNLFTATTQAPTPHTNEADIPAENGRRDVLDMNRHNLSGEATDTCCVEGDVKTCDGPVDANHNKINDVDGEEAATSHPFAEIFKKFATLAEPSASSSDVSNAPWPVSTRRTKFRVNQMSSRDVPIVRTEKPAKLQKQSAIDACDTKLFDEHIAGVRKSIFHTAVGDVPRVRNCIADLWDSFERDRDQMFHSHFRHKTFMERMPNGSISFDCGQLDVEQRSISTIRSMFQLHATTGRHVKQIQAKIEANHK
jgi:hypothetical protein